jgi:polyisoprenoid-binding protein YceI
MERLIRQWVCILCGSAGMAVTALAFAEPMTYDIDPAHTYPAFEADHQGGLSLWRGKINETAGSIVLDKAAESGKLEVTMNMASIDFVLDRMNEMAMTEILHVSQYPTATYTGTLADFRDGQPTAVRGTLTLHGVSKPVDLQIARFRCQPHFRTGKEVCGADATTTINRGDFGVVYDLANGFFPEVTLLITVEAQIAD